jgi:hypothetical protein
MIETAMSPLVPIAIIGSLPMIIAAVELRRGVVLGIGTVPQESKEKRIAAALSQDVFGRVALSRDEAVLVEKFAAALADGDSQDDWAASVDAIAPFAAGGLSDIRETLVFSHQSVTTLPWPWKIAPLIAVIVTLTVVFGISTAPVLSVEGRLFGVTFLVVVLIIQWVYTTAMAQFVRLTVCVARLMTRLAGHPDLLPYGDVPREFVRIGLFPKPPALRDLKSIVAFLHNGTASLERDFAERPEKRWYQTETWSRLRASLAAVTGARNDIPGARIPAAGYVTANLLSEPAIGDAKTLQNAKAISVVLVVKELLSRLSLNLFQIGPILALMVLLYATVYFDQSHCFLGLIWVDAVIAMCAVMGVFVWMDRDVVISTIRHTTAGEVNWDWDLMTKVAVYVLVPLATLFATQFPNVGAGLLTFLQPVQRLP